MPIIEIVQVIFAAIGAGFSANGWWQAREDYRENEAEGSNVGSLGLSARWRIARERSRLRKQLFILASGVVVVVWRMSHLDTPITSMTTYATRNFVLFYLSLDLMWDALTDRTVRREVEYVVRAEHRRASDGSGRRKDDASSLRMQGALLEDADRKAGK